MSDFLTINALSKNYANGFEALKTINLRVKESEILALLGPNGAGKTTLISTICGISKFTRGKITLADCNEHTTLFSRAFWQSPS